MRLLIRAIFIALFTSCLFALPVQLDGVWSAGDRYVLFDTESENEGNAAVVLRVYDKWYNDRTAEPLSYKESANRTRNSATGNEAEHIATKIVPLESGNAWEVNARYGKRADDETIIPVAVIGKSMYLNFLIKEDTEEGEESGGTFYRGVRGQSAIRACPMPSIGEVYSYYVTKDATYRLRYWPIDLTASEKSGNKAAFTDEGVVYTVPSQVVSLGRVFTCVTGRSAKIRNIEKLPASFLNGEKSSDGKIIALGAPSMTRVGEEAVSGETSRDTLLRIVSEANRRRCPPPKPLLPPSSVDWHIDLINSLEEGNAVIAAVRERSKQFSVTAGRTGREAAESAMQENSRLLPDW